MKRKRMREKGWGVGGITVQSYSNRRVWRPQSPPEEGKHMLGGSLCSFCVTCFPEGRGCCCDAVTRPKCAVGDGSRSTTSE